MWACMTTLPPPLGVKLGIFYWFFVWCPYQYWSRLNQNLRIAVFILRLTLLASFFFSILEAQNRDMFKDKEIYNNN